MANEEMVWIMLVKLMYIQILSHTQNEANSEQLKKTPCEHFQSFYGEKLKTKEKTSWAFEQNWKVTQHACSMFDVQCSHHANSIAETLNIIWRRINANIWQTFNVSDESALYSTKLEPNRARPLWFASINTFYIFNRCLANCLIIQQVCSSVMLIIVGCEILFIICYLPRSASMIMRSHKTYEKGEMIEFIIIIMNSDAFRIAWKLAHNKIKAKMRCEKVYCDSSDGKTLICEFDACSKLE